MMQYKQEDTPLWDAIQAYREEQPAPFHTPGHKMGRGAARLAAWLGEEGLAADLTEIGGLDNLAEPTGVIRAAEELTAELLGADRTFFLVNGTLAGFYAWIAAVCRPGDILLAARNLAPAAAAALHLSGVMVVYLQPEFVPGTGLTLGVSPAVLAAALERYPQAKAVILASPGPSGAVPDWVGLAAVCHNHGVPLLADETLGAHMSLLPGAPVGALSGGADGAVQHLPDFPAQGGWLQVRGTRVDHSRIQAALNLLQSTSPSYVTMAALDRVRARLAGPGRGELAALAEKIAAWRPVLAERFGLRVWTESRTGDAVYRCDPLCLTCLFPYWQRSVTSAPAPELSSGMTTGPDSLVFRPAFGHNIEDLTEQITRRMQIGSVGERQVWIPPCPAVSEPVPPCPPGARKEWVSYRSALGRTVARRTVLLPPDAAVLYPGERVSAAAVASLEWMQPTDNSAGGEIEVLAGE